MTNHSKVYHALVFPLLYLSVCPERLAACMLSVQKELSAGFISSTHYLGHMSYQDNDAAFYELVIQDALSNQNITLSAPGVEVTRIEKLRRLSDFKPAQKMLHVCVMKEKTNCMTCGKCVRVVTALDAMGTLERFGAVFDLKYYRDHKDEIWGQVIYRAQLNEHYASTFRDEDFRFSENNCAYYDPLTVNCFATDSLRSFLSGASVSRSDKLKTLSDYPEETARIRST